MPTVHERNDEMRRSLDAEDQLDTVMRLVREMQQLVSGSDRKNESVRRDSDRRGDVTDGKLIRK
jgi:hypothetical protein